MRSPIRAAALAVLTASTAVALAGCGSAPDPTPARSYAPGTDDSAAPDGTQGPAAAPGRRPRATGAPTDVPAGAEAVSAPRRSTPAAPGPATTDDGTRLLSIPAQGITAAVLDCPTKDGIVEPPPMVKDVCWWTGSRPLGAAQGVSIVVGHSTRSDSSTGALERTRYLPLGSVVTLAGQTWKVAQIETDVDKHGLPGWVTYATGPRMLGLVTCDLTNHRSNVLVRLLPA